MRDNIADVAKEGEVGCSWDNGKKVVGFWGFEMEVRKDLKCRRTCGARHIRRCGEADRPPVLLCSRSVVLSQMVFLEPYS